MLIDLCKTHVIHKRKENCTYKINVVVCKYFVIFLFHTYCNFMFTRSSQLQDLALQSIMLIVVTMSQLLQCFHLCFKWFKIFNKLIFFCFEFNLLSRTIQFYFESSSKVPIFQRYYTNQTVRCLYVFRWTFFRKIWI